MKFATAISLALDIHERHSVAAICVTGANHSGRLNALSGVTPQTGKTTKRTNHGTRRKQRAWRYLFPSGCARRARHLG
jgi:hypothetical protein